MSCAFGKPRIDDIKIYALRVDKLERTQDKEVIPLDESFNESKYGATTWENFRSLISRARKGDACETK